MGLGAAGVLGVVEGVLVSGPGDADRLGTDRRPDDDGLNSQERAIITLLAQGHTDEVIARKLGVSVRTSRRIGTRSKDPLR